MAIINKKSHKKEVAAGKIKKNKAPRARGESPARRNTHRGATTKRASNRGKANIKVIGVGGGGNNAISRMKDNFIRGVEFIAINTDVQDLDFCDAHKKICIGRNVTRGLGTGMNPELGKQAAEESRQEIAQVLQDADLVFVTTGLGGGTGSGASAIVAEIARDMGALTVAVVTKPFSFEGGQRMMIAEDALARLKEKVDAFIVVPNDRIFEIIGKDTTINKAFEAIDNVLRGAVQGIAELIAMPGMINVDFADVKTIMKSSGSALVGMGIAAGKNRGVEAVNQLLSFPLLEVSIDGARGVLFGVAGGRDLKMSEINEIAQAITANAHSSAKIIFGAYHDRKIGKGRIKVTLIATGFSDDAGTVSGGEKNAKLSEIRAGNLFSDDQMEGAPTVADGSDMSKRSDVDIKKPMEEPKLPTPEEIKKPRGYRRINGKDNGDKDEKKSSEIWDIPAFLRRRK